MGEHTQFDAQAVSDALRELMWVGVITNDTLAPLRYLNVPARCRYQGRNLRGGRRSPVTGGRWSAVPEESADLTRATLARTETLLGRYGIVSREMALADGVRGGFTGIYKVLRQMEESGRGRRGYFVEGLSGAQFSLPGAVDLLRRAERGSAADAAITALSALDSGQSFRGSSTLAGNGGAKSNQTPSRNGGLGCAEGWCSLALVH